MLRIPKMLESIDSQPPLEIQQMKIYGSGKEMWRTKKLGANILSKLSSYFLW